MNNEHAARAAELFHQGYNCSQSVAGAFAPEMGLSCEQAMRMSAGFGGGMGRLREVCGAFTGLVFVLSTLYGSADPARKTELYTTVQELAARFRERNGANALRCAELLGLEHPEHSPVAEQRTAAYYKKRPCAELVSLCAELLEEYIAAHPLPDPEL